MGPTFGFSVFSFVRFKFFGCHFQIFFLITIHNDYAQRKRYTILYYVALTRCLGNFVNISCADFNKKKKEIIYT